MEITHLRGDQHGTGFSHAIEVWPKTCTSTRPALKSGDAAGRSSSTSQPRVIAVMLEALQFAPGMKVLETGAGAACNASLIAAITGAEVVTIDVSEAIVAEAARAAERAGEKNVTTLTAHGYLGHLAKGPYDRIVATGGVAGICPHSLDQLAERGQIVVSVAHGGRTGRLWP